MRRTEQSGTPSAGGRTPAAERKQWTAPAVDDLPPLTELTLQTGGGIPGNAAPASGGTVF